MNNQDAAGSGTPGIKGAHGPTILLASGRYFDLLDPAGSQFDLTDIATALGKLCRFTGHCKGFYSVAEHSVHCARLAPPELKVAALLHDAAEAFVGDVSRPLKALLPEYKVIEKRIEKAIAHRFNDYLGGVELDDPRIKRIDASMLRVERMQLMPETDSTWVYGADVDPVEVRLLLFGPSTATGEFLDEAERIGLPLEWR
jgi:hypothetical protein